MTDAVRLEGVSVEQLQLLDDKVLVRVMPQEETRASGLLLLHGSPEHQVGASFYGEVVKVGPGTLVREGPTPEQVGEALEDILTDPKLEESEFTSMTREAATALIVGRLVAFLENHRALRRIPTDWKPGDRVMVKQGFGCEFDLREGRHHVVERAGKFGHGIVAAWEPGHVHCWHRIDYTGAPSMADVVDANPDVSPEVIEEFREYARTAPLAPNAACACGARARIETRLPACANCPPGERLAEAVLGGKHVYDVPIPKVPKAPEFDPERPGGFSAGELRPEA